MEESKELDVENVYVYRYDVDGESYTYKENSQYKKLMESGKKFKCYYNQENPQEIIKIDDKKDENLVAFFIIAFFILCIILSIIGAKMGEKMSGTFSFIPLSILSTVAGIVALILMIRSFFYTGIDGIDEIFGTIILVGMTFFFIGISGYASFCLIKEAILFIKSINGKKNKYEL